MSEPSRKAGFPRTRRRNEEGIRRSRLLPNRKRLTLPRTQRKTPNGNDRTRHDRAPFALPQKRSSKESANPTSPNKIATPILPKKPQHRFRARNHKTNLSQENHKTNLSQEIAESNLSQEIAESNLYSRNRENNLSRNREFNLSLAIARATPINRHRIFSLIAKTFAFQKSQNRRFNKSQYRSPPPSSMDGLI